jgi:hypothetical protein
LYISRSTQTTFRRSIAKVEQFLTNNTHTLREFGRLLVGAMEPVCGDRVEETWAIGMVTVGISKVICLPDIHIPALKVVNQLYAIRSKGCWWTSGTIKA